MIVERQRAPALRLDSGGEPVVEEAQDRQRLIHLPTHASSLNQPVVWTSAGSKKMHEMEPVVHITASMWKAEGHQSSIVHIEIEIVFSVIQRKVVSLNDFSDTRPRSPLVWPLSSSATTPWPNHSIGPSPETTSTTYWSASPNTIPALLPPCQPQPELAEKTDQPHPRIGQIQPAGAIQRLLPATTHDPARQKRVLVVVVAGPIDGEPHSPAHPTYRNLHRRMVGPSAICPSAICPSI